MTKGIISALVGILVEEKQLNIGEPPPVPEWNNTDDRRPSLTIKNLLQQPHRLNYVEVYSSKNDVLLMLFDKGNMAECAASHPLKINQVPNFLIQVEIRIYYHVSLVVSSAKMNTIL
jgi:hypothetical protein